MPARRKRPPGYYRVADLDLQRELRRLCELAALGGPEGELARKPPQLTVRRASARPRRNLGFAVPAERRISVTAYPGIRAGDAQEVLLHELVHIAVGRSGGRWHGIVFRRTLTEAMRQAYGIDGVKTRGSTHGAYAEAIERRRHYSSSRQSTVHPDQLALESA
jgi:hypothetical protein